MRGKSIDIDFVADFINECVSLNKITTQEICLEAKNRILEIDQKIKDIELLKIKRSKLMDVLNNFNRKLNENPKFVDKNIINLTLDRSFMNFLKEYFEKNEKISTSDLLSLNLSNKNKYDIKQLILSGILIKENEFLLKGPFWND